MALHTYRYRWVGVNIARINRFLPVPTPATFIDFAPSSFVDLSIDDSAKATLDEVMTHHGFEFVSIDPVFVPNDGAVLQWGNAIVGTVANTAWMSPGFMDSAPVSLPVDIRAPRPGILRNLYVRQNIVTGLGAQLLFYRVFRNGAPSALAVPAVADNVQNPPPNTVDVLEIEGGDRISLQVDVGAVILVNPPANVIVTALLDVRG